MATFINSPAGAKKIFTPVPGPVATGMPQTTTQVVGGLNTLHYGGSLNMKNGRLSAKPKAGTIYRKQARMELAVRLENAGLGEAAAAAMLCISVPRLRFMKKSPEYHIARMRITHGIIVDTDSRMDLIKAQRKEYLTASLPPALQVLANIMQSPDNSLAAMKLKANVAQDLLDREGTFAKISRTEIKPVEAFDFENVDEHSRAIINTIRNVAPVPASRSGVLASSETDEFTTHTTDAVEANEAFSNSHTMSQTDQERALEKLEAEAAAMERFDRLGEAALPQREIQ